MLSFSSSKSKPEVPAASVLASAAPEPHALDALTLGAFSAPTSSERMACIREWLTRAPSHEQLQTAFKALSAKDKGAAKLLREKLEEIKRSKVQATLAQEWADKAQALLALANLNLADALAWQRDAAKAGAPLSKEPLDDLKAKLLERVRAIEDLHHRVQVQREAAVLVAQRIEVLSTKPWHDALALQDALSADVLNWQAEAAKLTSDASWTSVDSKFPPLLQASQAQLTLVWQAFQDALALTAKAAQDATLALPNVPVWADELAALRATAREAAAPSHAKVDPAIKAQATAAVSEVLDKLEQEVAQGHGKASTGAANALRNALKEYASLIHDKLEVRAHAALAAAGELEAWQRWRADQLRDELVRQAEGLLQRAPGQAIGGRKMQETLRSLREQWKGTDQGGVPNHALWRRFDEACNEAHKVVETWLEKLKTEQAEHRAQRLALIDELKAWAQANRTALDDDWKGFSRLLHQFGERWREAGHVGEKLFAELQPLWQAALTEAATPLENLQHTSVQARQLMIEEALLLGAQQPLRIDAVKALQQRWQAEAQRVPLERRAEQKLWDAFRKPIDDAFNRKTAERESAQSALSERDRVVLEAAKALQAANAATDAQAIRSAMTALESALRGQLQAQAALAAQSELGKALAIDTSKTTQTAAPPDQQLASTALADAPLAAAPIDAGAQKSAAAPNDPAVRAEPALASAPVALARKPLVAMRGDDRPGKNAATPPARAGKFAAQGARSAGREALPGGARGSRTERPSAAASQRPPRAEYFDAPRLGDTAFRAQRDALEQAQQALRRLAAQAHGEALTQLLSAWQARQAELLPSVSALGAGVTPSVRASWQKALGQPGVADASTALLRLEMAAEVPTPAPCLAARRLLQLQLLTRRHDPPPRQTWTQDSAVVLASAFAAEPAKRLQDVLKVLLKAS